MMNNGMPSYEERLRNPNLSIIDFEYITLHPEAKAAIWERYLTDIVFKVKLNECMNNDLLFAFRLQEAFKSYLDRGMRR